MMAAHVALRCVRQRPAGAAPAPVAPEIRHVGCDSWSNWGGMYRKLCPSLPWSVPSPLHSCDISYSGKKPLDSKALAIGEGVGRTGRLQLGQRMLGTRMADHRF